MNRIRIIFVLLAVTLMSTACFEADYIKVADEYPDVPIQYDHDGDGVAEDYYFPNFAATVTNPEPGVFIVDISADQRSADTAVGQSHMYVKTSNGEVHCDSDINLAAGMCVVEIGPGEVHHLTVEARWRVANELLISGWVVHEG